MKNPSALPMITLLGVLAMLPGCGADKASSSASTLVSRPKVIVCRAFVRTSLEAQLQPLEEISMSQQGDRSVSSGPFRFRVAYDDDRYEGQALRAYVYSNSTGKMIEESLFQFYRDKDPVNQFLGGHGFTGLRYVYAPGSPAELQYFCSAG